MSDQVASTLSLPGAAEFLLKTVCSMLKQSRRSSAAIRALFEAQLAALDESGSPRDVSGRVNDGDLAAILMTTWLNELDAIDDAGNPKSLPLFGGSASVLKLLKGVCNSQYHALEVVMSLIKYGNVVEVSPGLYKPIAREVLFPSTSQDARRDAQRSIELFLLTILKNLFATHSERNCDIQRAVSCHSLPARLVPEFQDLVRTQGTFFLNFIDDWLASHQVNRSAEERCFAHVGLFSNVAPRSRQES
jgi:hypothetical protein